MKKMHWVSVFKKQSKKALLTVVVLSLFIRTFWILSVESEKTAGWREHSDLQQPLANAKAGLVLYVKCQIFFPFKAQCVRLSSIEGKKNTTNNANFNPCPLWKCSPWVLKDDGIHGRHEVQAFRNVLHSRRHSRIQLLRNTHATLAYMIWRAV